MKRNISKLALVLFIVAAMIVFAGAIANADQSVTILKPFSSSLGSYMGGEVVSVSDSVASAWVSAGYAQYTYGTWVEANAPTAQLVATNTFVVLTAASETSDLLGEWANGSFTASVTGYYHVQLSSTFGTATCPGLLYMTWFKGASDTFITANVLATGSTDKVLCAAGVLQVNAGQTLTPKAWQVTDNVIPLSSTTVRIKRVQ